VTSNEVVLDAYQGGCGIVRGDYRLACADAPGGKEMMVVRRVRLAGRRSKRLG